MSSDAVEKKQFKAEIGNLINLVVRSIYTNADIFVRELVSNASDAIEKRRYLSSTDESIGLSAEDYKIEIQIDKEKKTIIIEDNGVGMDKKDLVNSLGTIAKSGTADFIDKVLKSKNSSELIGQFGVGFYSVFMVAHSVDVFTKKIGSKDAYHWKATKDTGYEIFITDEKKDYGTKIVAHIKDDEDSKKYLDIYELERVLSLFSDNLRYKINITEKGTDKDMIVGGEEPIWKRDPSSVSQDEYDKCCKNVSYTPGSPLVTIHKKLEGQVNFDMLLFIPEKAPFDLYNPRRKSSVRLYVKRVFITEDGVDLLPRYLSFVRGFVDSDDLPLNIGRESIQDNPNTIKIKNIITSKVLSELQSLASNDSDKYKVFCENFMSVLKEGLCEPSNNKDALLSLVRFESMQNPGKFISLDEYVENMKEGQDCIYYANAERADMISSLPQAEEFCAKGVDVLCFRDLVDSFWTQLITSYKGKKIQSIISENTNLDSIKKEEGADDNKSDDSEKESGDSEKIVAAIHEAIKDRVKLVKVSKKLRESPSCLSISDGTMDPRMERFLMVEKQLKHASLKNMEINPKHQLVKKAYKDLSDPKTKDAGIELCRFLFDYACLVGGETLTDSSSCAKRMAKFATQGISL